MQDSSRKRKRPFKFFNFIAEHEDFLDVIKDGWMKQVNGMGMENIWTKLKVIKKGLKKLNTIHYQGIDFKVKEIRSQLQSIHEQMRDHRQSNDLYELDRELRPDLEQWGAYRRRYS